MAYFDLLNDRLAFIDFYDKNPQLLKRHNKKFKDDGNDIPYTDIANNYTPPDLMDWFNGLGKLYEYEKKLYCKVDRKGDFIILSWYWLSEKPNLQKRTIFLVNEDEILSNVTYVVKSVGTAPLMLLVASSDYHMGGWTDYDFLYKTFQRKITEKEQAILKSVKGLSYLPLDDFEKINPYLLLQRADNQNWIYQIEILHKMGLKKLALDIHIKGREIEISAFKMFRKEIMNGIRLPQLEELIYRNKQKVEKEEFKKLLKAFTFKDKTYNLGDYILRYPKTFEELETEGRKLRHCVASYKKRIIKNETEVLFLRKKESEGEPFYTVEYQRGKVIQVRTLNNESNKEITKLVEETLYGKIYENIM